MTKRIKSGAAVTLVSQSGKMRPGRMLGSSEARSIQADTQWTDARIKSFASTIRELLKNYCPKCGEKL